MKKLFLFAALVAVCYPGLAFADGKFFSPEKVPPYLPYQRALIAHDDARELLILQSKFQGEARDFGWVIPLPAVPELAAMWPGSEESLFSMVDWWSGPSVTQVRLTVYGGLFILCLAMAIIVLCASYQYKLSKGKWPRYLGASPITVFFLFIFVCLGIGVIVPNTMTGGIPSNSVEVVKAQQVGIYDVKVIKADDSGDLLAWLNEHGYKFNEEDKDVFKSYIKRGWCFVTARVDLKKAEQEGFSSDEGLVNPLVMLFESKEIVYPLALTGTIGSEVVVLLYIFDSHKVTDSSGRFALRYAGKWEIEGLKRQMAFQPEDFYEKWDFKQGYLTKLKATLTPGQMKKDLILKHAPDDEPYREHIYRW